MKTSQKNIIAMIDSLSDSFKMLTFRYGFDDDMTQHIISVTPASEADSDEFVEVAALKLEAFLDKYPDEGVLFVSDDPHINEII